MPKLKRKHPRLPNAFGSIRYLGKGRTNPYAVHPPAETCDDKGNYIRPKALCYVDDWYVGFAVLTAYHAGTYKPGDEITLKSYRGNNVEHLDMFCRELLNNYVSFTGSDTKKEPTFQEVYDSYFEWKYGENAKKKLSLSSRNSTIAAFKHCAKLYKRNFRDLRYADLQKVVNECEKSHATKEIIVNLIKQLYSYAEINDLCDKNHSKHVSVDCEDDESHGISFSGEELKILWDNQDDEVVQILLIMCYSGFRISAYKNLEVNLQEKYFRGGVKTKTSKNRIVPIHSGILKFVENRMYLYGVIINDSVTKFRKRMYEKMDELGIQRHTPHDCRHTFSALCEKYKVNEADRKRMLGHSFGSDITNRVYGHRELEDLRTEIEKIKI